MDSDLDLDLRYFEKCGFDLDLKFVGLYLKNFKSTPNPSLVKICLWIWFDFGFEKSCWIWIWFGFARMVDLHTTAGSVQNSGLVHKVIHVLYKENWTGNTKMGLYRKVVSSPTWSLTKVWLYQQMNRQRISALRGRAHFISSAVKVTVFRDVKNFAGRRLRSVKVGSCTAHIGMRKWLQKHAKL